MKKYRIHTSIKFSRVSSWFIERLIYSILKNIVILAKDFNCKLKFKTDSIDKSININTKIVDLKAQDSCEIINGNMDCEKTEDKAVVNSPPYPSSVQ